MASKSLSTLLQEINQNIVANGEGDITGSILNNILNDMTDTLKQGFFKYPKDASLTTADIGNVVMNDGSGTAKPYAFAPTKALQTFKWIVESEDIASPNDSGPFGLNEYYIKTFSISGTNTGDTFKIFFGEELFTATIAASQDNANFEAAYDASESTYRDNIIDVINAYNTNSGNDFLQAYTNDDSDKIDIVVDKYLGSQFVFIGQGNFQGESGGFIEDSFQSYESFLIIETDMNYIDIYPSDWRSGTPSTPLQELEMLRDYINGSPVLGNYTASINASDQLVIEQDTYEYAVMEIDNWNLTDLMIDRAGHPELPPAPSAYPLGKLVGIDGDDALISRNFIETYPLEAPITINQDLFDADKDIAPEDETLDELLELIIVPSENGKARKITFDDIVASEEDDVEVTSFRHNILGIAIAANQNEVTVAHLNHLGAIAGIFLRVGRKQPLFD